MRRDSWRRFAVGLIAGMLTCVIPARGQWYSAESLIESAEAGSIDGVRGQALSRAWKSANADGAGNVYWMETWGSGTSSWETKVRRITRDGTVTTAFRIVHSLTDRVMAFAVAPDGRIYFTQGRAVWRVGAPAASAVSSHLVERIAGGTDAALPRDGAPLEARFTALLDRMAAGPDGAIYVADLCSLRRIDAVSVTTLAGDTYCAAPVDGFGRDARFSSITALAVAPDGSLAVADRAGNEGPDSRMLIRRVSAAGNVTTWIGGTLEVDDRGGSASHARFSTITSLAFDDRGELYGSTLKHVFRISRSGFVTALAGNNAAGDSLNGSGAAAQGFSGLAVARDRTLYAGAGRRVDPLAGCGPACGARTDWDGDGRTDVLTATFLYLPDVGRQTARYELFAGRGTTFTPAGTFDLPLAWAIRGIGDLDGDGKADIVASNLSTSMIDFRLMDGASVRSHALVPSFGPDWSVGGAGDFDGDGKADVLLTNARAGQHLIWYMNGTTVVHGSAYIYTDPGFRLAGIGDLSGDGLADLVWYNDATGIIDFQLMTALGRGPTRSYLAVAHPWAIAACADFDGDGKSDLLWRDPERDAYMIWYMDALTVVRGSALIGTSPMFILGSVGDFDGDGRTDLLWAHDVSRDSEGWSIWLMDGGITKSWGG